MAGESPSRYEFRCWPDSSDLPVGANALRDAEEETRIDIYCVIQGRSDLLCKLRSREILQIKVLCGHRHRLEQWEMALDAQFPLSHEARRCCSTLMGTDSGQIDDSSPQHFLDSMARRGVHRVDMEKRRRQIHFGGVKIEHTLASVQGRARWTIGLEGEDPVALGHQVDGLGLSAMQNQSYGVWLDRIIAGT